MVQLRRILGSMSFGGQLNQDQSFATLKKFIDYGFSEVDTAIVYQNGETEKILGAYEPCRDPSKVQLACKVNPLQGFRAEDVIKQLDTSLLRLGVPSVDILYLHRPDNNIPIEETLQGIHQLYKDGKFKELGISNYSSWQTADIYHICKENGYVLPTVYQGMYNPITRDIEGELIPMLRRFDMRLYIYNPLAGGLLSGRYNFHDEDEKQPNGRFFATSTKDSWSTAQSNAYRKRFWRSDYKEAVTMINDTLKQQEGEEGTNEKISLYEASFRWIVHHSKMVDNDGVILGFSRPEHLDSNLSAMNHGPLPESIVDAFDRAWNVIESDCPKYYR